MPQKASDADKLALINKVCCNVEVFVLLDAPCSSVCGACINREVRLGGTPAPLLDPLKFSAQSRPCTVNMGTCETREEQRACGPASGAASRTPRGICDRPSANSKVLGLFPYATARLQVAMDFSYVGRAGGPGAPPIRWEMLAAH